MREDAPPSDRRGSTIGCGAEANRCKVIGAMCEVFHQRAGTDDGDDLEPSFVRSMVGAVANGHKRPLCKHWPADGHGPLHVRACAH